MAERSTAAEPDFPIAESKTINGVVYRCFEKDAPAWADVGHYVVACRARVIEAALAQQRAQALDLDIKTLETAVASWRKTAETERNRARNLETILVEQKRTEANRLYWQKVRDIGIVATVLIGVVVSVSVGVSR